MNKPFNNIDQEQLRRIREIQEKLSGIDLELLRQAHEAEERIRNLGIDFNRLRQAGELFDKIREHRDLTDRENVTQPARLISLPKYESRPLNDMQYEQESAAHLIVRLQNRCKSWEEDLPDDVQPVIYAMTGNVILDVESLTEESYHCLAVEGLLTHSGARCLLIVHQAGLQLLCVAEPITPEKPKRQIGFFTSSSDNNY